MHNLPKSAIIDSSYLSSAKPDLNIVKLIAYAQAVEGEIVAMANETKLIHCITTNAYPNFVEAIRQDFTKQGFDMKLYYTDPESFKICLTWYDRINEIEEIQHQTANRRSMVTGLEAEKLLDETYHKKDMLHE
jgi:hypothetical protein